MVSPVMSIYFLLIIGFTDEFLRISPFSTASWDRFCCWLGRSRAWDHLLTLGRGAAGGGADGDRSRVPAGAHLFDPGGLEMESLMTWWSVKYLSLNRYYMAVSQNVLVLNRYSWISRSIPRSIPYWTEGSPSFNTPRSIPRSIPLFNWCICRFPFVLVVISRVAENSIEAKKMIGKIQNDLFHLLAYSTHTVILSATGSATGFLR